MTSPTIYMPLKPALKVEHVDRSCPRNVLSDESRGYVQELLQRCGEEATSYDALLLPIVLQDGNIRTDSWKKILSIKK